MAIRSASKARPSRRQVDATLSSPCHRKQNRSADSGRCSGTLRSCHRVWLRKLAASFWSAERRCWASRVQNAMEGEHMNQKVKRVRNPSWILAALLVGLCQEGQVQQALGATPSVTPAASAVTLFQNVRIFDGKSGTLSGPSNVLVRGNKIERIATGPIPTDRSATTVLIDGGGRTLMPGLIDMHWHTMLVRPPVAQFLTADVGYLN